METKTSFQAMKERCITIEDALQLREKLSEFEVADTRIIIFNESNTPLKSYRDLALASVLSLPKSAGEIETPYAEKLIGDLK
ncbi:hypothetical protein LCGC14_0731910 [marine sediment metagenome]|uniref:Uncharacterized protein n=1 Tax=marine sediment metagenome TaxID=412755 RepID=A0A0F9Q991_9ZZZZ